ncbi:MAG TPA: TonB family protein [Pyrinomonadaceae bacterium]|nr:TonB family protein [Pyrinomonadaceae bacterium]
MFTNLIESNSHKREFRRRSSFFVATVAAYALVLTAAGIAGVLTYDAQVEAQDLDLTLQNWIPPVKPIPHEPDGPRPTRPTRHVASDAPVDPHIKIPERTDRVPPIDDLRVIPRDVGVIASSAPPVDGPVNITTRNVNPPGSTTDKDSCATCTGESTGPVAVVQPTPEPTPSKPPPVQQVSKGVLIAKIINMPTPAYPILAKQVRASGAVNVQILIDESGNVISAHAVNGHPMLTHAAEDAARRARFTPTLLSNQPVKVQGVITYNFVLQ